MLKKTYIALILHYTTDTIQIESLWHEIATYYSHKKRHYHTLTHLENLLRELIGVKNDITHWNTILFSLFYHDIIYNPLKQNNEEKSAALAEKRMKRIGVAQEVITSCKKQILATKQHLQSPDNDTNYFTDADLSILGQNWNTYLEYSQNIRKEYAVYPDIIYKSGRKKVLQHFLQMEQIFKTEHFFQKFEKQAKENLQKELAML